MVSPAHTKSLNLQIHDNTVPVHYLLGNDTLSVSDRVKGGAEDVYTRLKHDLTQRHGAYIN